MERKASGLKKAMKISDVLMYDTLTISFFSMMWFLLYAFQPVAFPDGSILIGMLALLAVSIPFFYSYYALSRELPLAGGDYVFQSKMINPGVGFVTTFTGWVLWQLFFLAWFGYYIVDVLLIPLIYYFGPNPEAISLISSPYSIFALTAVLFVLAFVLVARGLELYVKAQKLLFVLMVLGGASAIVITVLHPAYSVYVNVPRNAKSVMDTLGTWSLGWGALGYGMWSVLNNEEISGVRNKKYFLAMAASAIINVVFVIALWEGLKSSLGYYYIRSVSQEWFSGNLNGIYSVVGGPYYTAMMINIKPNPVLFFLLVAGAAASMFQVMVAIMIGASRVILSQALDGILPRSLSVVSDRTHSPVPAAAFGLTVSLVWLYLIVFVPTVGPYFVSVVFATQITWMFTMLAGIIMGFRKRSSGIIVSSVAGLILNAFIAFLYIAYPELGFTSESSMAVVAGISVGAAVYYIVRDFWNKKTHGFYFEETYGYIAA
ncbi:MAG: amino acid permease [Nitrososphaeria archaeon]